jgi:hypothetical protein
VSVFLSEGNMFQMTHALVSSVCRRGSSRVVEIATASGINFDSFGFDLSWPAVLLARDSCEIQGVGLLWIVSHCLV